MARVLLPAVWARHWFDLREKPHADHVGIIDGPRSGPQWPSWAAGRTHRAEGPGERRRCGGRRGSGPRAADQGPPGKHGNASAAKPAARESRGEPAAARRRPPAPQRFHTHAMPRVCLCVFFTRRIFRRTRPGDFGGDTYAGAVRTGPSETLCFRPRSRVLARHGRRARVTQALRQPGHRDDGERARTASMAAENSRGPWPRPSRVACGAAAPRGPPPPPEVGNGDGIPDGRRGWPSGARAQGPRHGERRESAFFVLKKRRERSDLAAAACGESKSSDGKSCGYGRRWMGGHAAKPRGREWREGVKVRRTAAKPCAAFRREQAQRPSSAANGKSPSTSTRCLIDDQSICVWSGKRAIARVKVQSSMPRRGV